VELTWCHGAMEMEFPHLIGPWDNHLEKYGVVTFFELEVKILQKML
jgi:hypothetical protein